MCRHTSTRSGTRLDRDIGPGPASTRPGGAQRHLQAAAGQQQSMTGRTWPAARRSPPGDPARWTEAAVTLVGAREHQPAPASTSRPLGCLVSVTGVPAPASPRCNDLARCWQQAQRRPPGPAAPGSSLEEVDKLVQVDSRRSAAPAVPTRRPTPGVRQHPQAFASTTEPSRDTSRAGLLQLQAAAARRAPRRHHQERDELPPDVYVPCEV